MTSLEPVKTAATLTCQGTQTGERVVVEFEVKGIHLATLDDLGMRAKMQEQLKEILNRPKGFVILSAIPAGGLRTTTKVVLFGIDRFVREFAAVEDEANRYDEIENIAVTTYRSAAGQSPADILPRIFRTQPNVIVVRDLVNAKTLKMLCEEIAAEGRMVVSTVRAKDSAEALLRIYAHREGADRRVPRPGHGRAFAAAGPQALRQVQGALRPAGGRAEAVGAAGRTRSRPSIVRPRPRAATRTRRRSAASAAAWATWARRPFSSCWSSTTFCGRRWPPRPSSTPCDWRRGSPATRPCRRKGS